jgi:hypothetical protein
MHATAGTGNVLAEAGFLKCYGSVDERGVGFLERAMGIEPTSEAWEALNQTLKAIELAALSFPSDGLNWKLDGNRKYYRLQRRFVFIFISSTEDER